MAESPRGSCPTPVTTHGAAGLGRQLAARFGVAPILAGGTPRVEIANGHRFVAQAIEAFPGAIQSIALHKPTLEDVFLNLTDAATRPAAPFAQALRKAGWQDGQQLGGWGFRNRYRVRPSTLRFGRVPPRAVRTCRKAWDRMGSTAIVDASGVGYVGRAAGKRPANPSFAV